jgi:hypothetical protein
LSIYVVLASKNFARRHANQMTGIDDYNCVHNFTEEKRKLAIPHAAASAACAASSDGRGDSVVGTPATTVLVESPLKSPLLILFFCFSFMHPVNDWRCLNCPEVAC